MVQNLPCPDVSLEKMLEASEKKSLLLPDNGVWDLGAIANASDNCHSVAIPPQIPKFTKTRNGPGVQTPGTTRMELRAPQSRIKKKHIPVGWSPQLLSRQCL